MAEPDKTPLGRMNRIDEILDEYESSIGLSKFKEKAIDDEVKKYLSMDRNQIEKLSVQECGEAALMLGGLSFHIQRCFNREMSRVNWADGLLKKTISGEELQYRGSWESQYNQAIKNNDYANDLLKLKNYAKQRADRLTYLASSAKNMSDLYKNLQMAKVMK
ncbi:MAG: hypothetical protein HWN81_09420 [Candidatus Lokiarchaeota archaeon]|nr:hypothetical protein [Candidatus Lokiarchaeota archaeon]